MAAVWWTVAFIVCLILEAATFSLVTIWFAIGAVGGLIAALFGASTGVQLVVFVVVSALMLIFTRPAVKKLMPHKPVPTNAELDIGKTAEVIEAIDSLSGTGRVRLDGVDWSARSEDGSLIEKGANVTVTASESTTLIVRKKN